MSLPDRVRNITLTQWMITLVAFIFVALIILGQRYHFGVSDYIQFILDGLRAGAIYALVAMGFVLVYRVTGVINFAQGAFVMLGPMITITLYERTLLGDKGWSLVLAASVAIIVTVGVGILMERSSLYPARHAAPITKIIITVGAYFAIQGAALLVWGPQAYIMPSFTTLGLADESFRFAGLLVKAQSFWIWGATIATLVLLALFFDRTLLGKAMRACSVNPLAARLMGIRVDRMATLAFALAALLGAVGGIVLGPTIRPAYDLGLELGLKGFVAAIMGGLVSFPGAVIGALLLGVLENMWAGVTLAGFKDLFGFAILLLLLLIRRQGFGGADAGADSESA